MKYDAMPGSRPPVFLEAVWRAAGRALVAASLLTVAACSSKPPTPDWQMNAQGSAQKALDAYLSGNARVEALEWSRARAEISRTGRADLLARLELMRCAAQVASLAEQACPAFERLRADAAPAEQAYADYLAGRLDPGQVTLLPPAQRQAASQGAGATSVGGIEDPLSRLVAAGVLLHTGKATPAVIDAAVDAASSQGWRRPLLAWLGVQMQRAEAAGDERALAALRRRAAIVHDQGATPR